ncbi:MAG: hypothetical protein RJA09_1953 [Pseudomonadota bacterium]
MPTHTQAHALRQARQHLLAHGLCPSGLINDRLAQSWQRSLAAGLQPMGRLLAPDNLEQRQVHHLQAQHHALLAHSRPVMAYLLDQVRPDPSLVVLAAPCGTLVHTHGDPYFLGKAERVALAPGANWHEAERGTNAIGTALAEGAAVEVQGAEHYLERHGFLTCAASPILSGEGRLLGVLDMSGEYRGGHPHTLGLVNTAARMIENRLLTGQAHAIRLHLHTQPEGIGTMAEAIVALSPDGWTLQANRSALALLGLQAAQLGAVSIEDWANCRLEDLVQRHHRQPGATQPLVLRGDRVVYAQVHLDHSLVQGQHTRAAHHRAGGPPADALAALDTGDTRWRSAADKTRRVLGKPIPVLVQGESGVGKEWFARAAHQSGPRRAGPFVAVNCAALPENLIEAELFGHTAGAYTGARREGRTGLLREAHGGTLFLDEIGDMPLGLQTRLLRVLQERQVTPLGGGKPVAVDFDLVCATHRDLPAAVADGLFRSDLYYRINGLAITLPPLRERSDFVALADGLLAQIEPNRPLQLAPNLQQAMAQHHWPGNLRQLANVLRTACAMLDPHEDTIDWTHLADDCVAELRRGARATPQAHTPRAPHNLEALSRLAIQQALENCRGNISQAARLLGISRQTLYRKLELAQHQNGSTQ